jgi:hypothetical protein
MTLAEILHADDPTGATEARRRETLARHILSLPFDQRRRWIDDHAKAASPAAAEMLRQDVRRVHGAKA